MTLAVARSQDNVISLVADTRISDKRYNASARHSLLDGKIKAVVIHPQFALAYANHVEPAEEAIKQLFIDFHTKPDIPIQRPYDVLWHFHKEYNANTDFLICDAKHNQITRMQNGRTERVAGGWIGDGLAFTIYQPAFHSAGDTSIGNAMKEAMNTVIHDTKVDSVGGYPVLITNKEEHGFQYAENAFVESVRARTIEIDEPGQSVAVPMGAEEGGTGSIFQYCGCSLKKNYLRSTAFYSHGATSGLLFAPWLGLDPIEVKGRGGKEFINNVKLAYGIGLNGFARHGNSALERVSSFS